VPAQQPGRLQRAAMSEEHKAALAKGRAERGAVRGYPEALERHRPCRGRRRTPDAIPHRLRSIEGQPAHADAISRLHQLKEKVACLGW